MPSSCESWIFRSQIRFCEIKRFPYCSAFFERTEFGVKNLATLFDCHPLPSSTLLSGESVKPFSRWWLGGIAPPQTCHPRAGGGPGQPMIYPSCTAFPGRKILFGPLGLRLRGDDKFAGRLSSPRPSSSCFFFP
jgi:hypothetical protein